MERPPDNARTEDPGRFPTAELQCPMAKASGNQADRKKIARQIDHVAKIVGIANAANHLVHHFGEIRRREVEGAAYADIEIAVLAERREYDAGLDDRLDHQEVCFLTELRYQRRLELGIAANRLVADIQRRVRP